MTVRVKYSAACGHGDELYIHYCEDFCSRVGFDVVGAEKEWLLESNGGEKHRNGVSGVIKRHEGWPHSVRCGGSEVLLNSSQISAIL